MFSNSHIKKLAAEFGFDLCGVAPTIYLHQNELWFGEWLANDYHGSLGYMERNLDKRFDPQLLVEGAKTAVVCAVSYKNLVGEGYPSDHGAKVASYACTGDYHTTVRKMLQRLFEALKMEYPQMQGRVFVDTAPLLEKQLAVEAGLGWIGRQSLLITPRFGSYVVLGELLLTLPTDTYDHPYQGSGCGRCNNCIDSCPNRAIVAPKVVDTRRCIACYTIEKQTDVEMQTHGWIFGCDGCQSCCPYNQKAPMHTNSAFDMVFDPLALSADNWLAMGNEQFENMVGTTPLTRSGLERIKGNIGK